MANLEHLNQQIENYRRSTRRNRAFPDEEWSVVPGGVRVNSYLSRVKFGRASITPRRLLERLEAENAFTASQRREIVLGDAVREIARVANASFDSYRPTPEAEKRYEERFKSGVYKRENKQVVKDAEGVAAGVWERRSEELETSSVKESDIEDLIGMEDRVAVLLEGVNREGVLDVGIILNKSNSYNEFNPKDRIRVLLRGLKAGDKEANLDKYWRLQIPLKNQGVAGGEARNMEYQNYADLNQRAEIKGERRLSEVRVRGVVSLTVDSEERSLVEVFASGNNYEYSQYAATTYVRTERGISKLVAYPVPEQNSEGGVSYKWDTRPMVLNNADINFLKVFYSELAQSLDRRNIQSV